MNMDAYERLSAENRRRGIDALIGLDEVEGSDEEEEQQQATEMWAATDLPCPFCDERFDGFQLCCHIEVEHQGEDNAVVCPVCKEKVETNLVGHITSRHNSFLTDRLRNRRNAPGSSGSRYSTLASLKNDLQSFLGGPARPAPVSTVPDPLLSSFLGNSFEADLPKDAEKESLDETEVGTDSLEQKAAESVDESLLPEVKEERTRRSQFVQGLVLSLIFDDIL